MERIDLMVGFFRKERDGDAQVVRRLVLAERRDRQPAVGAFPPVREKGVEKSIAELGARQRLPCGFARAGHLACSDLASEADVRGRATDDCGYNGSAPGERPKVRDRDGRPRRVRALRDTCYVVDRKSPHRPLSVRLHKPIRDEAF
jgi:hypothetical protein